MARRPRIGVIRGDGIGPEVVGAALEVLGELGVDAELVDIEAGLRAYEKYGRTLPPDFVDVAKELDAILKGPLQTPKGPGTPRSANVEIRRLLGLYANVRPFRSFRGISRDTFDFVIVRENTEDLYVGLEGRFGDTAIALKVITREGSTRVSEFAFELARARGYARVTAVHKANILKETDGLFREAFLEVASRHPWARADEMLVDAAAYALVRRPSEFQVIVTPNLYGDILSDLAAGMVGSLGLCGSGQYGAGIPVFEPVHGTAPDIAGKGVANPIGQIEAARLMLEFLGAKHGDEGLLARARALSDAVRRVVEERVALPPDLGGSSGTFDVARAIASTARALLEGGLEGR
ncbi:MAG: isocitrate/isopropylmalate dehydrogenase family protein [Desulfurococcaceae archaeon]